MINIIGNGINEEIKSLLLRACWCVLAGVKGFQKRHPMTGLTNYRITCKFLAWTFLRVFHARILQPEPTAPALFSNPISGLLQGPNISPSMKISYHFPQTSRYASVVVKSSPPSSRFLGSAIYITNLPFELQEDKFGELTQLPEKLGGHYLRDTSSFLRSC